MKTLRKIGIVTLASSLTLVSALAAPAGSPVAESIATFGNWGVGILWVFFGIEAIRTIGSLSHPKGGTVSSAAMGKMGDWLKKKAKKAVAKEVRVDREAMKEYAWLVDLKNKVDALPATVPAGSAIDDELKGVRDVLHKEEREERRFVRRLRQLLNDVDGFKNAIKEPDNAKIKQIEDELNALNGLMILNMANGGRFECALKGKAYSKTGVDASLKFTTAQVASLKDRKQKLLEIVNKGITLDQAIVAEMKSMEKIVTQIRNS